MTDMALETIITGAALVAAGLVGVRRVHDKAPDSLNELPAIVFAADTGDLKYPRPANLREIKHQLKLLLFVNRGGDFKEAETELRPYVQRVIELFDQNITLGGAATASGITRYEYGILTYAEVDYLGITFNLTAEEFQPVVFKP